MSLDIISLRKRTSFILKFKQISDLKTKNNKSFPNSQKIGAEALKIIANIFP